MRGDTLHRIGLTALMVGLTGVGLAADLPGPREVVDQLAGTGPRTPGSSGHRAAQELLLQAMVEAGLESVAPEVVSGADTWTHLMGVLPGTTETEIVLSARYDTVAGSRGVRDNASGCAVALSGMSDLTRTPRQTGVRLVLTDGEESLGMGIQEWLSGLSGEYRRRILANLDLDMLGFPAGRSGVAHLLVGHGREGRVITPAWLIHATLRAAETADLHLVVLDRHWSWWAQLAVRCALPTRVSDGRRFLESGVPAITLSDLSMTAGRDRGSGDEDDLDTVDGQRLSSWARVVAATTRRLDRLSDRQPAETEYLVLCGRVWIRRDLVWMGFLIWILLVWRGLPGNWRQRPATERRQMGRAYLPGFAFRMLFLLAVFLIPTFASLLLLPVAIVALAGSGPTARIRWLFCFVAVLPALSFALWMAIGQLCSWFVIDRAALLPVTLVGLTLATYCTWQLDS